MLLNCVNGAFMETTRKSFPSRKAWRASKCLELIHVDLCIPMHTASFGGSRYFLLFTDDCSRMSWVYFLETKSEKLQKFKYFKDQIEMQSGLCIKTFCTDRCREFLSKEFNFIYFFDENDIHRELTTPFTPEKKCHC